MPEDSASTRPAETRRLAAIMFTDIVGFSRQMGVDEARMLRVLAVHNKVIEQAVADHYGTVINTMGDAFLVDFPSVVHAVQCAQQIQAQLRTYNAERGSAEQIHVRIGIHSGDIVQRDGDVFGDGVNIAARLQALAEPDAICISDAVYRDVVQKIPLGTVLSLGRPKLKNIAQRFPVYALFSEQPPGVRHALRRQRLNLARRVGTARLARVALIVGGLVIGAGGVILLSPARIRTLQSVIGTPEALPLPDKPSLVVLPFVNMSDDPQQEYFSDGLTEDLTTDLSKVSGLFVIARTSAFTYKGKAVKAQEVSRELGVRYVLEGSVRRAEAQLRVTAQLVDATTGYHLWSERYDRARQDLFALQDEIRQKIVLALKVKLTPEEQARFTAFPTANLEAYDYLLRGREAQFRLTKAANVQARQLYEKAIELDPQYAAAYAALGSSHFLEWAYQWSQDPPRTLEQALALAQKAVALDDSLPYAHTLLGGLYLREKQPDRAIAEAERAIALAPNASSYGGLADILTFAGKPAEALGLVEKALRLDPQNAAFYSYTLGHAYRLLRRYEEAITALQRVLAHTPNHLGAHAHLAMVYSELGREEEARAEVVEVRRISPQLSLDLQRQMLPYTDEAESERFLADLRKAGLQ